MVSWARFWILMLVLSAGVSLPVDAFAQRRVPVTNADAPGKQPYQATIRANIVTGCVSDCFNYGSGPGTNVQIFDGPAVPAGKRLVIQWISASIPAFSAVNVVYLQSTPSLTSNINSVWQYAGPFVPVARTDLYGMSSPAFATVEPGEAPHVRIDVNQLGGGGSLFFHVAITGYLVDVD